MPIEERLDSVERIRQWSDTISLHYEYTAGVAGERFLQGLKQGKIVASRCAKCKETRLPARMYCVNCYAPIQEYPEVRAAGKVNAITTARGKDGETLDEPVRYAFVSFRGVKGGMVHRMMGEARVGTAVVPRFKPNGERRGSILDLEGFEPAP